MLTVNAILFLNLCRSRGMNILWGFIILKEIFVQNIAKVQLLHPRMGCIFCFFINLVADKSNLLLSQV